MNILNNSKKVLEIDPTLFGFKVHEDYLIPQKVTTMFPSPEELVPGCHCKKCSRKTCGCRVFLLKCCDSCSCQVNDSCKNPINTP